MSTFLADGVARLLLATAILLAFVIAFIFAAMGVAFAQDVVAVVPTGPAPVDDSWAASIALIKDSLIATILAVIAGVLSWASSKAPAWLKAIIDKATTSEALNWEEYVSAALTKAFDVAAAKVGVDADSLETMEQKADFLGTAVGTLRKYNKDIVAYLDKDANGVIDLVELELLKRGAPAKLFEVAPVPFPVPPAPQAAMGFMEAPTPRRGVAKVKGAADLAATFAPRKRGTVVQ